MRGKYLRSGASNAVVDSCIWSLGGLRSGRADTVVIRILCRDSAVVQDKTAVGLGVKSISTDGLLDAGPGE